MHKLKTALMLISLLVMSTLYPVQVKAQEKTDSLVTASTPVFSGQEKNLTDSLLSVGKALTDPELKATVVDAVNVIKATPKSGGFEAWYAWLVAALGAVFGVYQYVKRKLAKKQVTPPLRGSGFGI
jgi:hypothetical protein